MGTGVISTLIVDDDAVTAAMLRRFVEHAGGFAVTAVAGSAGAARRAIAAHHVDLVLLDLNLPDGQGLELTQSLRRQQPHLDVIVISMRREVATVRQAMRSGALHYLVKPVRLAALVEVLQKYAALNRRTASAPRADQARIDEIFRELHAPAPVRPKGITEATLGAVRDAVAARGDCSADEIAAALGLSRPTAARYLEYLTTTGHVARVLVYGSRGRPQHHYRTTELTPPM